MSVGDQTYMSAPEFIVEFPDLDPPDSHEVDKFPKAVPVRNFNRTGRVPKGVGTHTDANSKLMQCVPVVVEADDVICTLLNPITGIGLINKKMKLIQLGRDDDDGQVPRFEAEMEGLEIEPAGYGNVVVTYKWYEHKIYRKGDSTLREEYDFIKNIAKD